MLALAPLVSRWEGSVCCLVTLQGCIEARFKMKLSKNASQLVCVEFEGGFLLLLNPLTLCAGGAVRQ